MRGYIGQEVILYSLLADSVLLILAGVPSTPVWNEPSTTSFTFEFTDTSGCEQVTRLRATPSFGTSLEFSVVSQGPDGGFGTVRIDDTTAKLTCNLTNIENGTYYNVHVRALDTLANEFKDIALVMKASKLSSAGKLPVFVKPNPDPASPGHTIPLAETAKGGDTVMWFSASDPDTAIAYLTYSMDNSNEATKMLFEIAGNKLSVKSDVGDETFDYDKEGAVRQYPITLRVSDGQLSSSLETSINVQDVNDIAPVFETIPVQYVGETTTAGSTVFQAKATDADGTTENSKVQYKMTGSSDFTIDETNGVISVAPGVTLNYDVSSDYILIVTATDNAVGNALSSSVSIAIEIITAPRFTNLATNTFVEVEENAAADTPVFELTVADKDQMSAPSVSIHSQTPTEMFRLDGYVLKPKLDVTLNADVQSEYYIKFSATDGTTEVQSAILTVTIIKVETSTPKVNQAIQRVVPEHAQRGYVVVNVNATGLNEQNTIQFSMNGGQGDFVINPSTGKITVAPGAQLDYTDVTAYTLLVTASDGDMSFVTPVIVNIKTSPVFVDPANSLPSTTLISVPENTAPETVIKLLTVQDEDGDSPIFKILSQTPSTAARVFDIKGANLRTSKLNTLDTLDVDAADAVTEYVLKIRVSDGRVVSIDDTVNVTITILDSNEPPTFPEESISQNVLESTTEGNVLLTVMATDVDRTQENREIKYTLSGTASFDINQDTGDITLATGTVLNQTDVSVYTFLVIASDSGTPAMSSTVSVTFAIFRDGCSKLTDDFGTWPVTEVGNTSFIQCQTPYEGNVSRVCEINGVWGAIFSQCQVKDEVFLELKQQLNLLSDRTYNVADEIEGISKTLAELTEAAADKDTIANVIDLSQDIVDIVENTKNVTDNGTKFYFETISNIVMPGNKEAWNETEVKGSAVLDVVDRYLAVVQEIQCNGLNDGDVNEIEKDHLYTEVGRKSGNVTFPNIKQITSAIDIPDETLHNKGVTDVCFGGSVYNTVGDLLEKQVENQGTVTEFFDGQVVNSEVIAIQLLPKADVTYDNLNPPVRVTLTLINENLTNPVCVFWDYNITNDSGGKGAWSTAGCVVVNVTNKTATCECTHLTNFAILMSPSNISGKHAQILGIISAVGCAISMICLVLTIASHAMVWRIVRSSRTITLMNLCAALLLALGIFLAGVNRTESPAACAGIAALIQYLFLAVFFLMLLIGIEILLSVIQVFGSKFAVTKLLPVAWLAPAVIVGVSMGVTKTEGYGNDRFCWLDIDSGLIWSFIGPVLFVIFVNIIIIGVVFKKMASSSVMKSKTMQIRVKTSLRSLCVLLPVMGLTWILGILSVNSDLFILQYLFSICNTLQGLFIFLFHCVFNRQIRDALRLRKDRRKTLETFTSELRNTKEEKSRSLQKEQKHSNAEGFDNNAYISSNKRNEELLQQHEQRGNTS